MLASYVLAASSIFFSLVSPALGHGYVKSVTVGGKAYDGYDPNTTPYAVPVPELIVRAIPNDGPVTDVSSLHLACNNGGETPAKLSASIASGGKVTFQWTTWPQDHLGPVSTYMASCGGKCSNLDLNKSGSKLEWFKVDATGYNPTTKRWPTQDLIDAGNKWTSTVPTSLVAGEYLMRHEIIALHALPAQMYPVCLQLTVTGSGTAQPSSAETVQIPGIYDDVTFPNIWDDNFKSFPAPGPAAFGSSGSSPATTVAPATTKASTTASATSTSKAATDSPAAVTSTRVAAAVTSTASTTSSSPASTTTVRSCRPRRSKSTGSVSIPTAVVANVRRYHGRSRLSHDY